MSARTRKLTIRLTDDEYDALTRLADDGKRTISQVIRDVASGLPHVYLAPIYANWKPS